MEFLVEFEIHVPDGTSATEVSDRQRAEAAAAAQLASQGRLARIWERHVPSGETRTLGLYRADSRTELDNFLGALPLAGWMNVIVTPLDPHPNDPEAASRTSGAGKRAEGERLPEPRLTLVYRLEATLGEPVDVGDTFQGHRRIVPQTGGKFTGPELTGRLLPGVSADWQLVLPDGTALADLRYALETDRGAVLYVRSRGVRHGSPDVLARLARGDQVDASQYTFRTATQIETADHELDWLNKGVFISVGGRQPAGVIYETYLVG